MIRLVIALLLVVSAGLAVTGCRAEIETDDAAAIGVAR
jgi:hypothetical protein